MEKRLWILVALVAAAFGLIYFISTGSITGNTVYDRLSSIFSGNALSTMGPTVILLTIFSISAVALHRTLKK